MVERCALGSTYASASAAWLSQGVVPPSMTRVGCAGYFGHQCLKKGYKPGKQPDALKMHWLPVSACHAGLLADHRTPISATIFDGILHLAGRSVKKLAERYDTPLYVFDFASIRNEFAFCFVQ
jgi:hypothetical protein